MAVFVKTFTVLFKKKAVTCCCAIVVILTVLLNSVASQSYVERRFTMKDGLPSNQVYGMLHDEQGFLWFATDNGVSRYDGKVFKNFGMEDGLPDRDIFTIVQEKDGTIWVSSYKGGLAFFNPRENRFNTPEGAGQVYLNTSTYLLDIRPVDEGLLVGNSAKGNSFIFKNKKLQNNTSVAIGEVGKQARTGAHFYPVITDDTDGLKYCYVVYDNGKSKDSLMLTAPFKPEYGDITYRFDNDTLYIVKNPGKLYIVTAKNEGIKIDSILLKKEISSCSGMGNKITIATLEGDIYAFDKKKLTLYAYFKLNEYGPYVYNDNTGNIWVATLGRGVIWLKKNYIDYLFTSSGKPDQRFMAISIDAYDRIYGGNFLGEIVQQQKGKKKLAYYLTPREKNYSRTRGIIRSSGKTFVFFDVGGYINYTSPILLQDGRRLKRIKSCLAINDTSIIVGVVNTAGDGGLYFLNTRTAVLKNLKTPVEWVSSLAHLNGQEIYLGAANGLYKYNYIKKEYQDIFKNTILREERILSVVSTCENLLVVATAASGLYFLKEDKITGHIPYPRVTDYLPVCLAADGAHALWIGTKGGVVKLVYSFNNHKLNYHVVNCAPLGALLAADINAMCLKDAKLYLATGLGAGVFDTHTIIPLTDIRPVLTEVLINQKKYPVSDSFKLSTTRNAIALSFSGVDINGNLKLLQYSLDTAKGWADLPQQVLNLQLNSGVYTIWVRTINESGLIGSHRLRLYFNIKYPLYSQWWFMMMTTVFIVTATFITYNKIRNSIYRRKERNRMKIEQERNRIMADLHDEIGASLSSLQMYSDAALQILDSDKEASRTMLNKISLKAYKISVAIGDIIWSVRPVTENSMSIGDRIRNILHEMLADTSIKYSITVDEIIDSVPKNFLFKKNIILLVKEAVNNSIKYGDPEYLSVKLVVHAETCMLLIEDNGSGFHLPAVIGKGNGLSNMKMRVTESGGAIDIITEPGAGVKIVALFPLAAIN